MKRKVCAKPLNAVFLVIVCRGSTDSGDGGHKTPDEPERFVPAKKEIFIDLSSASTRYANEVGKTKPSLEGRLEDLSVDSQEGVGYFGGALRFYDRNAVLLAERT